MDPDQDFLGPFRAFDEAHAAAYLALYEDAFRNPNPPRSTNSGEGEVQSQPAPSSQPGASKSASLEKEERASLETNMRFQSHLFLPFVAAIMNSESILEHVRARPS